MDDVDDDEDKDYNEKTDSPFDKSSFAIQRNRKPNREAVRKSRQKTKAEMNSYKSRLIELDQKIQSSQIVCDQIKKMLDDLGNKMAATDDDFGSVDFRELITVKQFKQLCDTNNCQE